MSTRDYSPYLRSYERGALVVVCAVIMLVLLIFIGYVVNVSIMATVKSQQQHATNGLALAALDSFFREQGTLTDRLTAARQAVVTEAEVSAGLRMFHKVQLDSSDVQKDFSMRQVGNEADGKNGFVEPGLWFAAEPTGGCGTFSPNVNGCPCNSGVWHGACFRPSRDDGSLAEVQVNAFRVGMRTSPDSPLSMVSGGVVGTRTVGVQTSAIATLIPRRVVFLVDVSGTVVEDSHPPRRRKYSLFVDPDVGGDCSALAAYCNAGNNFRGTGDGTLDGTLNAAYWAPRIYTGSRYDASIFNQLTSAANPYDTALANYACVEANSVETPGDRLTFLVETSRNPQPLTAIKAAIHQALQAMQDRGLAGDEVAILFFDDGFLNSRATTKEVAGVKKISMVQPAATDAEFALAKAATAPLPASTDSGYPAALSAQLDKKFLMPRLSGSKEVLRWDPALGRWTTESRNVANTHLSEALRMGRSLLLFGNTDNLRPDQTAVPVSQFFTSENMIVLFSDGYGNCSSSLLQFTQEGVKRGVYCSNAIADLDGNGALDGDSQINWSMAEVFNITLGTNQNGLASTDAGIVANSFVRRGISLHFFGFGDRALPHNVLRKDSASPGRCVSPDREYAAHQELLNALRSSYGRIPPAIYLRAKQNWLTMWSDSSMDSLAEVRDVRPGHIGMGVEATGGSWNPVRPPCPWENGSSRADCQNGALMNSLDTACDNKTGRNFITDTGNFPYIQLDDHKITGFQFDAASPDYQIDGSNQLINPLTGTGIPGNQYPITDRQGRLICDPYCRSLTDQITGAMTKIIRKPVYSLVRESLSD